jgi:hypothetical protein
MRVPMMEVTCGCDVVVRDAAACEIVVHVWAMLRHTHDIDCRPT